MSQEDGFFDMLNLKAVEAARQKRQDNAKLILPKFTHQKSNSQRVLIPGKRSSASAIYSNSS